MDILKGLLSNIAFLLAFLFLFNITKKMLKTKTLARDIIKGLLFGLFCIGLMLNAYVLQTGAIFDTRSVLISVVALFFSPLASAITALIATGFRVYIGGVGVYAGVATIVSSYAIGLVWKYYVYDSIKINRLLNLYIFGIIVHILMMLSQLLIPYPLNIEVLSSLGWVVMVFYPLAVLVVAVSIINQEKSDALNQKISEQEETYRTIFSDSPLGMIQFDNKGLVKLINTSMCHILRTDEDYLINLDLTKLPNRKLVAAVQEALDGQNSIYEGVYESIFSHHQFPARAQISPLQIDNQIEGGIMIVQDLTNIYEKERKIVELTNYDLLTKLGNRHRYDNHLERLTIRPIFPTFVIVFDINTFQAVNESFGYDVGNDILVQIGLTLKKYEKPQVSAYRIGGDEFALIVERQTAQAADSLAHQIKDELKNIQRYQFEINVSFGIAAMTENQKDIYLAYNQAVANMHANKIYDGSSISKKTVDLIMTTLFDKSQREKEHSDRVGQISEMIAKEFHLGTAFTNQCALAGKLHDIGKINISLDTLDKPGPLTDKEWLQVKKHPESGFRILNSVKEYMHIANIVLAHHEHFDGKGYPRGIKGHDIPLTSRIITLADAYDAMTKRRPYKPSLNKAMAIDEIKRCSGTQFDPDVVKVFLTKVIDYI